MSAGVSRRIARLADELDEVGLDFAGPDDWRALLLEEWTDED